MISDLVSRTSRPEDVTCHEHAECVEYEVNNPQCVCNVGYIGDGVTCEAAPEDIREFPPACRPTRRTETCGDTS